LEDQVDKNARHIRIGAARSGRPSRGNRTYRPDELVRVEIRMPAAVAAQLFARARDHRQPVSRTASDLLSKALEHHCGGRMS
jgi:hypothetical protein